MSMCNHNIISNSSFLIWEKWLNQSKEKVVISQKSGMNLIKVIEI